MEKMIDKDLLCSEVERLAQSEIESKNGFGLAYFVQQGNEIVCEKCFGTANIGGTLPVTKNTLFRIASMSKPIAAVASLILIEKEQISLTDPVKKYLPGFEDIHIITPAGVDLGISPSDITIMHLLTHTSGFGTAKGDRMTADDKKTIQSTINYFIKAGIDFEPFTKLAYSAFGAYDAVAAIVENVTGEAYSDFLKHKVFEPCNMNDTTFAPTAQQWSRMIDMHSKSDGENCIGATTENCVFEDFPCNHMLAGAGLVSTLSDYAKFAQMLLNKGVTGDKRILAEHTLDMLAFPYVRTSVLPGNYSWGLGVRVVTEEASSVLPIGAYGWSGAYGTHFWIDPKNQIAAVLMRNSKVDGGAGSACAQRFENCVQNSLH